MNLSEFTDAQLKQLSMLFKRKVAENERTDYLQAQYFSQAHLDIKRELLNRQPPDEAA